MVISEDISSSTIGQRMYSGSHYGQSVQALFTGWGQTYELYDLMNDPGEKNDISSKNPDKVNDLSLKLKKWLTSCEESNSGGDY